MRVYADETRPLLQGSRLTAWELMRAGVDVTLICDNTAADVLREGRVQAVLVGADRIAANGDTANKVGTYGLALLAARTGFRSTSSRRAARSTFVSGPAPAFPLNTAMRARWCAVLERRPRRRAWLSTLRRSTWHRLA